MTTLADLLIQETQADILDAALQLAKTLGLPVTSWQAGDPTRSLFMLEAQILATLEQVVVGFIQAGFLDSAAVPNADGSTNPWLAILAKQVFNVGVPPATYATTTVTLTNSGGGIYVIGPGDLTFKSSTSGATYHNTSGGTLTGVGTAGATLAVTVVADQAGAASTAGAGEINALVTALLGVACTNAFAAVGSDEQAPATTVAQCRAKWGSLSGAGPSTVYDYVANNPALTGINTIAKSKTYPTSATGQVVTYVASAAGPVGLSDLLAVQSAILKWAAPLCITPEVISAYPNVVNVAYTLWLYSSVNQTASQIAAAVSTALANLFKARPIGGDIIPPALTGTLAVSLIESTIGNVYKPNTFRVQVTSPAADLAVGPGDVLALGAITPTIVIVPGP